MTTPWVALTLAGSRSGAGASIHDDLATLAAHGARALTAETVHDTTRVPGRPTLSAELVPAQALTALDDLPAAAVKTGHAARGRHRPTHGHLAAAGRCPTWSSTRPGRDRWRPPTISEASMRHVPARAGPVTPDVDEAAELHGCEGAEDLAGQRGSGRGPPHARTAAVLRAAQEAHDSEPRDRGIEGRVRQASSVERVTKQQMRVALEEQGGRARLLSAADASVRATVHASMGRRLD